jgi:PEP-CTERM motif
MRFCQKLSLIAAAALGCAALPAQAAVQVTAYQYSPPALGGGIAVDSANFAEYGATGRFLSTIQDLASMASLQRYTFCIDVMSGYYTYAPFDDVTLASMFSNPTKQAALAGLLTYANPTIDGAGSSSNMSLSAAAFSLAIWEVVYETSSVYNLSGGNFHVYGDFVGAGSLANSYLANVQSGLWSGNINSVRVLKNAGTGPNQNQIYLATASGAVPEPATWAMLMSGFALVGAAMRRRVQPVLNFAKA